MDARAERLVIEYRDKVIGATLTYSFPRIKGGLITREDVIGEAEYWLVVSADRWEEYCERNGYSIDSEEYFYPYAARRCKGAIIDLLRARGHLRREHHGVTRENAEHEKPPLPLEDWHDWDDLSGAPDSIFETKRLLGVFVEEFKKLDKLSQVVLALYYFEGKTMWRIGEELGRDEHSLGDYKNSAILKLRDALRQAASIPPELE